MSTAIVVGAGPNGLAAAVTLAKAGVDVTVLEAADEIGGGTRTIEAIVPGLLHDHCSAIHPMAVGSPFLAGLGLERIDAASQLTPADVTMFDLAPEAVAGILGDRLPPRIARAYRRFRRGPGAFKVDFAVEDGVPWSNAAARRAGTVHLAGTYAEMAATERNVHAGRMPERPFVLVGQQYLADPLRSVGNIHPVWAYAHVPNGYSGDATAAIIGQIERFAPGFRDRVIGQTISTTTHLAAHNLNFIGGDIMTGAKDFRQLVFGPRITLSPYRIGVPGMYICSAATPPGPGAHGMCGAHAGHTALKDLGAQRQAS